MFLMLFVLNIGNSLDHGAIPVINPILRTELNLNSQQLGTLGSLVFFGLLVGSIFAAFIFNKASFKTIMLSSYIGNAAGLFVFAVSKVYWI